MRDIQIMNKYRITYNSGKVIIFECHTKDLAIMKCKIDGDRIRTVETA